MRPPVSRRPEVAAPSIGVVIAGALAVAVVVLFVASVAFGSSVREEPGDRVALVSSDAASGYDVLVGRCDDERVRAIEIRDSRAQPLWRVESDKGSFERRFTVGGAPFGFAETVPLRELPIGPVDLRVAVGDVVDGEVIDLRDVDEGAAVGAACGDESVGAIGWAFALGAALVVGSYAAMLLRFRRRRR